MPAAAEEAREQVEGVMVLLAAALLPLLKAFVPVLVVDFAGLGIRESFVGFGHFDELLFGCVVVSGESVRVNWGTWEEGIYGFLSGWYFLLRVR